MIRAAGLLVFRRLQNKFEYLLMQTSYGRQHWTPPKGHVDEGESDYQAAVRETVEESGLVVGDQLRVIEDFCHTLQYDVAKGRKSVIYWLAELTDPAVAQVTLSDEHRDFKWLPCEEACALANYRDFNELLRSAERYLSEHYNN